MVCKCSWWTAMLVEASSRDNWERWKYKSIYKYYAGWIIHCKTDQSARHLPPRHRHCVFPHLTPLLHFTRPPVLITPSQSFLHLPLSFPLSLLHLPLPLPPALLSLLLVCQSMFLHDVCDHESRTERRKQDSSGGGSHQQNKLMLRASNLKLQFRKYPAMHTNRMLYHCTTLQYNHNIWHDSYAEAKF